MELGTWGTYHDQNASIKPNHEKKKTRPYLLKGFRTGTVRAFLLMGLTSGSEYMALKTPILRDDIFLSLK